MYSYTWDAETGGLLLNTTPLTFSKEPRPVYYKELDILGFDRYWNYAKDDSFPYMWAEANTYIYRGRVVAKTKGGSLYTAPELLILGEPEPDEQPLRFVDIPAMVEKNRSIMDGLVLDTIKRVANTYDQYKQKVDIFHVSLSGGKDSEVELDIVQRALPHNAFVVIFGDTGMEFPDTYHAVDAAEKRCKELGIKFFRASSNRDPHDTWKIFGPPSKTIRWCCSVHKTAPQLLKLRQIVGKTNFREMAFVGVRADESLKRSAYEYISLGTKHKGQYSCNPILEWNSAEVYLYIYTENLFLNDAYRKGNSRAGCLVCPMSADKSDFIRYRCYPSQVESYMDIVRDKNDRGLVTQADIDRFVETGGWKVRKNGQHIISPKPNYSESDNNNILTIKIDNPKTDWKQWMKTVGCFIEAPNKQYIQGVQQQIPINIVESATDVMVTISKASDSKSLLLVKQIKEVFRKSAYCILCRECEADCQIGAITMVNGKLLISDNCVHCGNCHKPENGCLLYHSLHLPKGVGKMNNKSIDSYADHAPKLEWFEEFFDKENVFFERNALGKEMISKFKRFLRDAELAENNELTSFAYQIKSLGLENASSWGLMLANLAYAPEVGWYIIHTDPWVTYSKAQLIDMLANEGVKERGCKSITGAYKRFLNLPFGETVGLGVLSESGKELYFERTSWSNPDPLVILYSLYKYAEACDGLYQLTLARLMNFDFESEGVSPAQIFGLDRETMQKLLMGLSVQYPDYISATFTLDLDNINLRDDKQSSDVLELF